MELNGISASIPPVVQPQATSGEPEVTTGEEGGGKANGVVSKLNDGDHFKGVADIRLRISHFDNPDLIKIDPALDPDTDISLLSDPEDVPNKAYAKFLSQYTALYEASQVSSDPVVSAPEPEPQEIR